MTREEILNMPAGREMDSLVAALVTKAEFPHDVYKFSTDIADAYDAVEAVYKMGLEKRYVVSLCAVMVHDFGKTSLSKEYHANAHQQARAALLAVFA